MDIYNEDDDPLGINVISSEKYEMVVKLISFVAKGSSFGYNDTSIDDQGWFKDLKEKANYRENEDAVLIETIDTDKFDPTTTRVLNDLWYLTPKTPEISAKHLSQIIFALRYTVDLANIYDIRTILILQHCLDILPIIMCGTYHSRALYGEHVLIRDMIFRATLLESRQALKSNTLDVINKLILREIDRFYQKTKSDLQCYIFILDVVGAVLLQSILAYCYAVMGDHPASRYVYDRLCLYIGKKKQ